MYVLPEGIQRCYLCRTNKPIEEFTKVGVHRCKVCVSNIWQEFSKKSQIKYRNEYRKGGKYYLSAKARRAVYRALKNGSITKHPCEVNNNCSGRIEAHHYLGYEKEHWLDVKWLCSRHHQLHDIEVK